jgi:signal transduction histidine kinase
MPEVPALGSATQQADAMVGATSVQPLRGIASEHSGLVHDVGNLLGALALYAELLGSPGVLHEEYRGYADDLRLLSDRSSALLLRLMPVSQKKEEACETAMIVSDVIVRMHGLLDRIAGRRVEIELGPGCGARVNVATEIVERIVTNLVKNAGEALGAGDGKILLRVDGVVDASEMRVVLTVSDTGCGMTERKVASLGHEAGTNGRGIGFRVVRELAALSGGLVKVASAPGEGTTVTVEWRAEESEIERHSTARRVSRGAAGWIGC